MSLGDVAVFHVTYPSSKLFCLSGLAPRYRSTQAHANGSRLPWDLAALLPPVSKEKYSIMW